MPLSKLGRQVSDTAYRPVPPDPSQSAGKIQPCSSRAPCACDAFRYCAAPSSNATVFVRHFCREAGSFALRTPFSRRAVDDICYLSVIGDREFTRVNFELTPKQKEIYETVGTLGRDRFAKRAPSHDRDATVPIDNLKELGAAGILKLTISEDLGGASSGASGKDPLLYLLAVEQTARYCMSTAQCLHVHCHGAHFIDKEGSQQLRDAVLRPVVDRGALISFTGSEPGRTARGLYSLLTTAERTAGGYRIAGLKNYATLAEVADFNLIAVGIRNLPPKEGHLNVVVPRGAQGLNILAGSWNPLGMRGAASPSVKLDNCFVPDQMVLGDPGLYPRERWQARFHLSFAAQYLGGAEAVFDFLADYLPKRGTAGDSYAQLRMGEIRVGIDSARWMIYRAAWMWTQGNMVDAELASMAAKHRAIENAIVTMDKAAQIAGSSAFWADSPLSRLFRDLRIHTLHENLDKSAATLGKYHLGQEFDTTSRL